MPAELPAARFAVETALLDIAAQRAGRPAWALLRSSVRRLDTRPLGIALCGLLAAPPQAGDALLDAAEGWLRERGCDRMLGPMDFSMNEESGVLTEGFELEPLIRQPWHPPYYQRLCEAAGLREGANSRPGEFVVERAFVG